MGFVIPAVFSDEIVHAEVAKAMRGCRIMGAGTCVIGKRAVKCTPGSVSLNLPHSSHVFDTVVLTLFLKQGLSGLKLQNAIMAGLI